MRNHLHTMTMLNTSGSFSLEQRWYSCTPLRISQAQQAELCSAVHLLLQCKDWRKVSEAHIPEAQNTAENRFFTQAAIRLQNSFLLGTLDARALDKTTPEAIKYRVDDNSWKLGWALQGDSNRHFPVLTPFVLRTLYHPTGQDCLGLE